MFGIIGAGFVAGVIVLMLVAGVFGGDDEENGIVAGDSDTPTPTPTLTVPGETEAPTDVLTDAPTPIPTLELFAQINGITLSGGNYVVDYETIGYEEVLPGMHIHFFFDTVAPEEAGLPGDGPWQIYGGPNPFTGYSPEDRSPAATEMCSLVAREDHSVYADSGNCSPLPDA